jgi:HAD superfamily hydrolase (TIGR01509 family)
MKNGFSWNLVTHVLVDLDGTLLDRDFDDRFWERTVPVEYARKHGLSFEKAYHEVMAAYKREEGSLNWFDIDFWSRQFDLNILEIKVREGHGINALPGAYEFLEFTKKKQKSVHLVTDAHPQTVAVKMEYVPLRGYFDSILSSFDVGYTKGDVPFWQAAQRLIGFEPTTTLFIDDRLTALSSARRFGIAHIFHKALSSRTRPPDFSDGYHPVFDFTELLTCKD